MIRSKFIKQPNGTRVKEIILPDETHLKIIIPENQWSHSCSRSVAYWIKQARKGSLRPFRFGKIIRIFSHPTLETEEDVDKETNTFEEKDEYVHEEEDRENEGETETDVSGGCEDEMIFSSSHQHSMEYSKIYTCEQCKKIFKTTGGLSKHRKKCSTTQLHSILPSFDSDTTTGNIREHGPVINVSENQNVTVNIQNNITLREFGKENPRWLTSSFLYNVIQDIPRAIPRLLERKHFNDEFPENKNLRIDTRRSIDKRLQVYETGRWKIKDSKQTFYRVLLEIYDILCDALENDLEDSLPDPDDNRTPEEQSHISNEIKKLKTNQRFIQKLERIRPVWDDFREKINDHDHRNELWEDLKTLLLDRHLAIEQGFE